MVLSGVLCLFLFCVRIPSGCCSTIQSIKPWLLLPRPGYLTGLGSLQLEVSRSGCSSCCLISSDLIDWFCSISFVLQPSFAQAWLWPGLTLTILLFSSRLPFPTVWTLTSALLISVLSINVTPLIILHLGLSSKLVWQNPDENSLIIIEKKVNNYVVCGLFGMITCWVNGHQL